MRPLNWPQRKPASPITAQDAQNAEETPTLKDFITETPMITDEHPQLRHETPSRLHLETCRHWEGMEKCEQRLFKVKKAFDLK